MQETYAPGMSVSLMAGQHGSCRLRCHIAAGSMSKEHCRRSGAGGGQRQVRELRRLLGKKTLENEILHDGLNLAKKTRLLRSPSPAREIRPSCRGASLLAV
jgi:hypothetical protein